VAYVAGTPASDADLDAGETLSATGGTCPGSKRVVGGQFAVVTSAAGDRSDLVVYESVRSGGDTTWTVSIIADDNNNNVTSFTVTSVCVNP
jgi:hypothetical protein